MPTPRTLNNAIQQKALKLLKLASVGGLPVAMASPPTITLGTAAAATTISGSVLFTASAPGSAVLNTTNFSIHGSQPQIWPVGDGVADYIYAAAVQNGSDGRVSGSKTGGVLKVPFHTDADTFEFLYRGWNQTGYGYRIWIDGQPTALAARLDDPGDGWRYIKVAMGSAKNDGRRIMIEFDRFASFGGVRVGPNYSVWKAPIDPMRLMAVGDSYTENGGAGINSYGNQMGFHLGVSDTWINGEGGIGYNRVGNQTALKPRQKLSSDVIAYAPDWVTVALGINDPAGGTAGQTQTEAGLYLAELLAGLPNTIVTVIGPWRGPSLNTATTYFAAVKAAVEAQPEWRSDGAGRIAYIDTLAEYWQSTGAGKVGATSGSGNSNIYISSDGIHPPQAGIDYLAARSASAVKRHAQAIASRST